jgi:hypothetical protein
MNLKSLDFQGFPDAIEWDVRRAVEEVTYFLPHWISHLHVVWDGDDNENDATISTEYEYRRAVLTICPGFLHTTDKHHTLIHEIGHIVTDPFTSLTERIIETLVPEAQRAFATGEVARHKEMLAEDIALLFAKLEERY